MRFGIAIGLLFLGMYSPAVAQQSEKIQIECTASVDGHVVDSDTHEPVVGASVEFNGRIVGFTDMGGRFALRHLCNGRFRFAHSDDLFVERFMHLVNALHEPAKSTWRVVCERAGFDIPRNTF